MRSNLRNTFYGRAADSGVLIQVAQLPQRDRAAGWVSYGEKWKTGTGKQYFTDIIYLFEIKAKGQYWPLTCNTNHNTMQEVSIKTNSNMHNPN